MLSKVMTGLRALAITGLGAFAITSAQAVQITCPDNVADAVTGTTQCEYSDQQPADNGEATVTSFVNAQLYFGMDDWTFGDSLTEDGGANGSWDISALIQPNWEEVMLVFKSANSPLIGYLVADGTVSGTWTTPFLEPPFDFPGNATQQDVSYIRVYFSENGGQGGEVPEPTTMLLLGAGLLALGIARRRPKRD